MTKVPQIFFSILLFIECKNTNNTTVTFIECKKCVMTIQLCPLIRFDYAMVVYYVMIFGMIPNFFSFNRSWHVLGPSGRIV